MRPPPSGGLPAAMQGLSHVGRSIQVRAMAERQTQAQLVQCPRGHTPQVVPPLRQPPPGWPAMPYHQAVQPPSKSTGRGVASNPSADKTAPAGSPSSQDRRRPTTRGRGDGGRSISHPRGVQEKASVQLPHQEGDLLSRSMSSVPPPAAPERTLPQQEGWPKTSHCDPTLLATKFYSVGWKKDLEHVLRVCYKYNAASFKEAVWVKLKDKFFTYFLPHKKEALGIKERCPMDYIACMEEHFWRATGLRLNGSEILQLG